ncbi:hypothetical protein ACS2BX_10780 [Bacillus cereus group sp. BceL300]|uniref:hypothetical protein n=1 Tax=Bacillus cereus group TaxID=86661 RepID=UPI002ABF427D|nr:hypothetical protein [Bacillus cereus]MDZ4523161.1 hypothetical protein [Bacillus cereus]HDR4912400.1 hypothetical protein [Bacillus cereus]HDR4915877.1 hypothetical protein [Bacillus cereus]
MDTKGFKDAVETLKLYHRIKNNDLNVNSTDNEELIEELYVDLLPNLGILEQMLTNEATFLIGRRGTGKSTIIARAQHKIRKEKRHLSVYINAKSVHEMSKVGNITADLKALDGVLDKSDIRRLLLLRNFLFAFEESLLEELKYEKYGFFKKITNHFRNKRLQNCIEELNTIIENPELINISNAIQQQEKSAQTSEALNEIKVALKTIDVNYKGNIKRGRSEEKQTSNILARYFNMGSIIDILKKIIEVCEREKIYIFIDDFSELDKEDMISFVDVIVSPLYHLAKDHVNLKIACYPNRIYYGDLDIGKYKNIYIDMFDIYGKHNVSMLEKSSVEYTKRIIMNRVEAFCSSKVEDYFDIRNTSIEEYYKLLYQGSMNIIRVLGHILHYCWLSNLSHSKKINKQAIEEACEQYYLDYTKNYFDKSRHSKGVYDEKLDIFVQENLMEALVHEAQKNKLQLKEAENSYFKDLDLVPTSHFMVSSDLENLLGSLEFNGFLHKVNELASKGKSSSNMKNATNTIYALDYGLTVNEKIRYGKPKSKDSKFYQQRAFDYTHIVTFALINNKKIVCQNCKKEFSIEELELLKRFKMKCDSCESGICKIEYDRKLRQAVKESVDSAVWSNDEMEIIHSIYILNKNSAGERITATLIGQEIDRSYQFVSRRCKELSQSGYVNRNGNTPFDYSLSEKTIEILEQRHLISEI